VKKSSRDCGKTNPPCGSAALLTPRCGSRARGDQRPNSDTDIMIEFDPAARITVFDYAALKEDIAAMLGGEVDVVNRDALKPYVKPAATSDAVYAF
jgi:predicted nucleotidyltransferase